MHNKSKTSLDDKLDIAIAQLLYMKDVFQEINESNELEGIIQDFDNNYGASNLSFNKKLDFILWSYGKILKSLNKTKASAYSEVD